MTAGGSMRKLAWAIGVATFLGALGYSFVSLYRWEWTRALYFAMVALIAEVGLMAGLVLHRLAGMRAERSAAEKEVVALLRDSRTPRHRFAWLAPERISARTNVFITMFVGGGVVLSGLAWLIDRIAGSTTGNGADHRLARELGRIEYPAGGLHVDAVSALAHTVPHADDARLRLLLGRST